jgi:DNA-binding NtrC family response regulator
MENKRYPDNPILMVDDEKHALKSYEIAFLSVGINNVICCDDSREALKIIEKGENIELIILDLMMPHISGEDLLKKLSSEHPEIPVIIVTGLNRIDNAVECMKNGASDFIPKPVKPEILIDKVRKCLELKELKEVNVRLQERIYSDDLKNPEAFSNIISNNKRMLSIFHYCEAIAGTRQPVLITGETGVGKELFAEVIHILSGNAGNFMPVNISGFDDNMLSDTLFGHRKGAFTGALDNRNGIIEKASGGTLFLDEIGDLNLASQVKLLRLLQEGEYSPIGSDSVKISDARVVLATNRDLWKLQQDLNFRKDLYYRISTHHIQIPPLRERKDDIKLLLDHFIIKASKEMGKTPPSYHPELVTRLKSYHYPGNIRELEGMVYDALSNHKSKMLSMDIFINHIERNSIGQYELLPEKKESVSELFSELVELPSLKSSADILVSEAMKRSEGNQSVAAKMLGISPQALSARLKKGK